jgi:hypothetical protein
MPGAGLVPADEQRHRPGPEADWHEAWWFDAWAPDGSAGVATALVLFPNTHRAWYWAVLVRAGEPLLHAADLDLIAPTAGLRVRTSGLWADHVCEAPFEQWTVVNELYAVALDDPDEALGRAHGLQAPMAFDLEWYATAPAEPMTGPGPGPGYTQAGEVHGEIELQGGALTLEGLGARGHSWGAARWGEPSGEPVAGGLGAPVRFPDPASGREQVLRQVLRADGWHRWRRPLAP